MRPLLGAQLRQERLRDVEHAVEVDRHDVLPVLEEGVRIAGERIAPVDAGIVDQDGDAPDLGLDLFRHGHAVVAFGDVERVAFRLAAGGFDLPCGLGRRLAVDVERHDLRAFARIAERDGAADARAGAGDRRDVGCQKIGHGGGLPGFAFLDRG